MRVIGVDFGTKRIGLALSDASATLATPWRVLTCGSPFEAVALVGRAVDELAQADETVGRVVVGWPRRLDGSATKETARVEAFAAALGKRLGLPVTLQDERLSSREAEARLAVREPDWRRRKAKLDAAAAAIILQDYLDQQPRAEADVPRVDAPEPWT